MLYACRKFLQAALSELFQYKQYFRVFVMLNSNELNKVVHIKKLAISQCAIDISTFYQRKKTLDVWQRHKNRWRYIYFKASTHWNSKEIRCMREQQSCLWPSAKWTSWRQYSVNKSIRCTISKKYN